MSILNIHWPQVQHCGLTSSSVPTLCLSNPLTKMPLTMAASYDVIIALFFFFFKVSIGFSTVKKIYISKGKKYPWEQEEKGEGRGRKNKQCAFFMWHERALFSPPCNFFLHPSFKQICTANTHFISQWLLVGASLHHGHVLTIVWRFPIVVENKGHAATPHKWLWAIFLCMNRRDHLWKKKLYLQGL